jgi:hypothetical protein
VGLCGLSDEEALRYVEMISHEEFQSAQERENNDATNPSDGGGTTSQNYRGRASETATSEGSISGLVSLPAYKTEDEFDHDLEEAIRLSLLDGVDDGGRSPRANGSGEYEIHIKIKQKKGKRSTSSSPSTSQSSKDRTKNLASPNTRDVVALDSDCASSPGVGAERSGRRAGARTFQC